MSFPAPNLEMLRQQTDAPLHELIEAGTADGTTAGIIEVLHSIVRRLELLEHPLYAINIAPDGTTTVNPAGPARCR